MSSVLFMYMIIPLIQIIYKREYYNQYYKNYLIVENSLAPFLLVYWYRDFAIKAETFRIHVRLDEICKFHNM